MLTIQNLTYRIAGRTLLEDVSLKIPSGHRIGLVGPNGTGKTTLFKLITGEVQSDAGDIAFSKNAKIGIVKQEIEDDGSSLLDVVLNSDVERASLLKEIETCEDMDRLGTVYTRLEEISAYDAPARAASILAGLGFDEEAQARPLSDFSGGWRMRVSLASTLFLQPNLLLLDEPTNHLDFEALIWLENYLMKFSETLILISHDRDILNKACTHIISLESKKLVSYTGNYDTFERLRAERLLNQQALHEKQQAAKAKMMAFVDRFRAKASKARQAQSRLKMIEKMDLVDAVMAERVTAFTFPNPDELASPMIALENADVGYSKDRPVLRNLNLRIDNDDRIALLGANGNGKSTLVKLLSGRLQALQGEVRQSSKLRVGYFAQFQTDELDPAQTPFEILKDASGDVAESKLRAMLGAFGFDKHKADTKVGDLSGGEKARLLFCLMSRHAPHIMLLDEPTNHLDIDAREALMQALNNYTGAVILVSHDPHLVEAVAERLWIVADKTCRNYDDDLEGYRQLVMRQRRKEKSDDKRQEKNQDKNYDQHSEKPATQQSKKMLSSSQLDKLEQKIADLTAQKNQLENELADIYSQNNATQIARLNKTYNDVCAKLLVLEEEWVSAT